MVTTNIMVVIAVSISVKMGIYVDKYVMGSVK